MFYPASANNKYWIFCICLNFLNLWFRLDWDFVGKTLSTFCNYLLIIPWLLFFNICLLCIDSDSQLFRYYYGNGNVVLINIPPRSCDEIIVTISLRSVRIHTKFKWFMQINEIRFLGISFFNKKNYGKHWQNPRS